jgi:protein gp37
MKMAHRLEGMMTASYMGTTKVVNGNTVWTGRINRSSDATMQMPLRKPGSHLFFVNSMSDFWHENAKDEWRKEALDIMRRCPRHQFQVLTKRPQNIQPILDRMEEKLPDNLWLGCTVEDHRVRDRIDILRQVPASIRFLSVEPMVAEPGQMDLTDIHWVIGGGESGPGARRMKPAWARELRDQCLEQGVKYFFKQWGTYWNNPLVVEQKKSIYEAQALDPHGKGGSLLDGVAWKQFPRLP